MSQTELLEKIHGLPVKDQIALAEAILHGLGGRLNSYENGGANDLTAARRRMMEAAHEAIEYYRTDSDVRLWRAMEGEPYHEAGTDLAGGPGANDRSGNV